MRHTRGGPPREWLERNRDAADWDRIAERYRAGYDVMESEDCAIDDALQFLKEVFSPNFLWRALRVWHPLAVQLSSVLILL
jgi:hypothetical protein